MNIARDLQHHISDLTISVLFRLKNQCLSYTGTLLSSVNFPPLFITTQTKMVQTRKTRIPSVPYLEYKVAELSAIANPKQDEIVLLAQYKKLLDQRIYEKYSGLLEKVW